MPQADPVAGSLCIGGGAACGMVSSRTVLSCGFLGAAGVLRVELDGIGPVESGPSVATQRRGLHVCSAEHGRAGGVCEFRHRTQDGLDAPGSAAGDQGVMGSVLMSRAMFTGYR